MSEKRELLDALDFGMLHALANLHTVTVAKVENVRGKTIDVRPVINRVVDGVSRQLPLCIKVPPVFMQGGGSYTAYPIAVGDYALLVITERSFDRWYEGADFQSPIEMRMHDYSDGFAIVGVNPKAAAIAIPSVITHVGNTDFIGDLNITGDISCTGRITCANATIAGIDFASHVHSGVQSGGSNTGGPA